MKPHIKTIAKELIEEVGFGHGPGAKVDRGNQIVDEVWRVVENYRQYLGDYNLNTNHIYFAFETHRKKLRLEAFKYYRSRELMDETVMIFRSFRHFMRQFPTKRYWCPNCERATQNCWQCTNLGCFTPADHTIPPTGARILIIDRFQFEPKPYPIYKPILE